MNTPYDAANRRAKRLAHIEHTKTMSAFHDGANTPEIKAAIDRARTKILKRIKNLENPAVAPLPQPAEERQEAPEATEHDREPATNR